MSVRSKKKNVLAPKNVLVPIISANNSKKSPLNDINCESTVPCSPDPGSVGRLTYVTPPPLGTPVQINAP